MEAEFRSLVVRGAIHADTFVRTESMADWQPASVIPELLPFAEPSRATTRLMSDVSANADGVDILSFNPGLWDLLWRGTVVFIGIALVIPAPWVATWFCRWLAPHVHVPGRRDLGFAGQPMDIWYAFMAIGPLNYASWIVSWIAGTTAGIVVWLLAMIAQGFVAWTINRWVLGNLLSSNRRLPISFNDSAGGFVGWYLLMIISFTTIIGWAWVSVVWMQWICDNIEGTRRGVVFTATGLELFWQTLIFAVSCVLLIPLPFALRWYMRWFISQFALVEMQTHTACSQRSPS